MIDPSIFWLKALTISMTTMAILTLLWLIIMWTGDKIQDYRRSRCEKRIKEKDKIIKSLEDELERYKNS